MKALVLFSGGVDSTTCLGMAVSRYGKENVTALSVSYGQKHMKEIEASRKIAEYYGVEHLYLDLEKIFMYSDCSLLSHSEKEIPQESYARQLAVTEGKPVSTYVPFRTGLFPDREKRNTTSPSFIWRMAIIRSSAPSMTCRSYPAKIR